MCIPIFTKCCFCFPLRKGVLSYGYIHLILSVLGSIFATISALLMYGFLPPQLAIIDGFIILEALFLIILIIACHKKKASLLRAPFIYNKVWWVLSVVLTVITSVRMVFIYKEAIATNNYLILLGLYLGACIFVGLVFQIVLRTYVILWIKGLIIELKEQLPIDANEMSHILEGTEAEYEETIQNQNDIVVVLVEDNRESNTEYETEVQIDGENEDGKDVTPNEDDKIEVYVVRSKKDSIQHPEEAEDIELKVMN